MGAKKVGTITLEHENADGVMESNAYDAEFNNATISGDVSFLEGTFAGKLTANAVNVLNNLHIAGQSVAITYISTVDLVTKEEKHFTDDGVYRYIHQMAIEIPDDMTGAWVAISMQYLIGDTKGDNNYFPCRWKVMIDETQYYLSSENEFGRYYDHNAYMHNELVVYISGPGVHTFGVMWAWFSYPTSVYPRFYDIVYRADVIRK